MRTLGISRENDFESKFARILCDSTRQSQGEHPPKEKDPGVNDETSDVCGVQAQSSEAQVGNIKHELHIVLGGTSAYSFDLEIVSPAAQRSGVPCHKRPAPYRDVGSTAARVRQLMLHIQAWRSHTFIHRYIHFYKLAHLLHSLTHSLTHLRLFLTCFVCKFQQLRNGAYKERTMKKIPPHISSPEGAPTKKPTYDELEIRKKPRRP